MGYIYKITNIISKKVYIGETINDPNIRFNRHLCNARNNKKNCPALMDAIRKYGEENFKFEVLIICFDEDRLEYEKEYIKKYNSIIPNGYNILEGGQQGGGFKGKTHNEETRKKIIEKMKKRYDDLQERLKQSKIVKEFYKNNPDFGKEISKRQRESEKWKKAVSEGRYGRARNIPISQETKEKISKTIKEKNDNMTILDRKNRAKGYKVGRYSNDNKLIDMFNSIREASRILNIPRGCIMYAIKNSTEYRNFLWKRLDE